VSRLCCWVPQCGRRRRSNGLCDTHYHQWQRGEPLRPAKLRKRRTLGARLDDAVEAVAKAVTAEELIQARLRLREVARDFGHYGEEAA
jgi:hypothetical protein